MSKKILEIRLKSDICMGSGYSYAGIIDSDTCYDDNGIPYIPGKRLKGCLREAAEYVCSEEEIKEIFGERDNDCAKGIMISNAYIPNCEQIREEISKLKSNDSEYKEFVTQQGILKLFTRVKAQTSINEKTGVAEPTSLRFMRVVNQYSCLDNQEMVFEAKIEYDNIDDEIVAKIAKALRHIGMARNRGLGNVRCSIRDCKKEVNEQDIYEAMNSAEKMVELKYFFTNIQPLMLSANNDNKSETYINGQSILGALAGAYIRNGGNAEGQEFRDIFLSGKVKFHNAYLTDENSREYFPVPLYMRKLKISKKYVNVLKEYNAESNVDDLYKADNGNQPKKIQNTYINIDCDGKIDFLRAKEIITYHHTGKSKNNDEKLYSFKVLKENQSFIGRIECSSTYARIIVELLNKMTFRLGKSKTAQYGCCRIDKIDVCEKRAQSIQLDGTIVVTLESNGIFIENNTYTNRSEDVRAAIAKQLGFELEDDETRSYMQTCVITGYNTKWNMKKPALPAVEAGSAFVFKLKKPTEVNTFMIGERNLEGYGRIRINNLNDMNYKVESQAVKIVDRAMEMDIVKPLLNKLMENQLMEVLKLKAISFKGIKLSASMIGRLTLMLNESEKDYNNFYERVCSIKRDGERNGIINFLLSNMFDMDRNNSEEKLKINVGKILRGDKAACDLYNKIKCLELDNNMWSEYLKTILVNQKYMLARGEQE